MISRTFSFLIIALNVGLLLTSTGCSKPSKAEQMRHEKRLKDSLSLVQANQTVAYSDSLLNVLQPRVDSLLPLFRYEKNEQWEDKGFYVHRLLQTQQNTQRNYLQAMVRDDGQLTLQSFYYGARSISHNKVRLSAGEVWVEAEGSNHTFEAEGTHEILTIPSQDAMPLLRFISEHANERLLVTLSGRQSAKYYLQSNEKQALAQTCHLALIMQDIATLEQTVNVKNRQIQVLQQRQSRPQKTNK